MKRKLQAFDVVSILIMIILSIIMLFPFWYSVVGSLNEGTDYLRGGVYLFPRVFTLSNYRAVFQDSNIIGAFQITVIKSLLGTLSSLLVTSLASYALSRPELRGKKFYIPYFMLTMYFGGGLIPSFILIKNLKLYDNFLVYILPGLFSVWNMIIIRTNFSELPYGVIESAKLDGAGEYRIFFQIVVPLSKAVLAAVILFSVVGHWNSYFDSLMYTSSRSLQTLQLYLRRVITEPGTMNAMGSQAAEIPEIAKKTQPQTIKLAAMVVTALPIICIYPFLQKYFVKGVMVGSIKG